MLVAVKVRLSGVVVLQVPEGAAMRDLDALTQCVYSRAPGAFKARLAVESIRGELNGSRFVAGAKPKDEALVFLEVWGLRIAGRSLKDPTKLSTGGRSSVDDEMSMAMYVEATPGFAEARPVLRARYIEFAELECIRIRLPGETVRAAFKRLGWEGCDGLSERQAVRRIHDRFLVTLQKRLAHEPWVRPSHRNEDLTGVEIGDLASDELRATNPVH